MFAHKCSYEEEMNCDENKDKKDLSKAKNDAYSYLSHRMRTVFEMRCKLKEKHYDEDIVNIVIRELINLNYLDDYEYALRYYEYNRNKKRGVKRAEYALKQKGVDSEVIENAREDFEYETEKSDLIVANEIAQKVLSQYKMEDITDEGRIDDRIIAKIARKLDNAGFSISDVSKVLANIRCSTNC